MSVEICVLTDSLLVSTAEWQRAIDTEGFPLRLSNEEPVSEDGGRLMARVRDKDTSFQYWIEDPSDLISAYSQVRFDRTWKYAVAFPFIVEFAELTAVWMAAAAYARATGGVVFDEQAGKLFSGDGLAAEVQQLEHSVAEAEEMLQNLAQRIS